MTGGDERNLQVTCDSPNVTRATKRYTKERRARELSRNETAGNVPDLNNSV